MAITFSPHVSFPFTPHFRPISFQILKFSSRLHTPPFNKLAKSVQFDRILTAADEAEEIGDGFLAAVEALESSAQLQHHGILTHLSSRELQLVLVYFAQEGRDAYCALEVFDWLRRENRVDGDTMELMTAIACGWIERIVGGDHEVGDVVGLIGEMECVGLEPGFSLVEKVVAIYWERGERERAVEFVKDVARRGGVGGGNRDGGQRGGPVGYLAWKMMVRCFQFI